MVDDVLSDPMAGLPWKDRPGPETGGAAPRSDRDVAILRSLARRLPPNDAGAHNNLGVVYYNKGLFAEAAEQFERALELDHRLHVAERNLQIVYFGTAHYDTTLRELQAIIETSPEDSEARVRLARMFLFGGDAGSALREFRRLLARTPGDVSLHRWVARAQVRLGDLDSALATLMEGAAGDPADPHSPLLIGEVMYLRGMAAEARNWLERSILLDDTNAEAHHILAFVCGELGDDESAHTHATRSAALNPSYARTDRSLSLDGYNEARYAELIGDRANRPEITERGGLIHYNLGLALRQKALFDDAMREFRMAHDLGEDRFLVLQAEAETLLLSGDSNAAVAHYTELIELEPASPKLWNELGVANHQLGRVRESEEMYDRSINLDASYALAWNNLAIARHHRGADDAADALDAALKAGRSPAEVARNLAWLRHVRGESEEAERAYRRALDVDARLASAWTGLGMLYLEQGQPQQAARMLARAVECDPKLPEAHYHYAFALSASGDYPGALRETSRALELNPYITTPRFRLMVDLQFEDVSVPAPDLDSPSRVETGSTIESFDFDAQELDAALGGVPDTVPVERIAPSPVEPSSTASIEWLAAARTNLEGGQFAQAISALQRATAAGGNRVEVQLLQGEIHGASGAVGEAVERFEGVLAELDALADPDAVGLDGIDVRRRALAGLTRAQLDLERPVRAIDAAERWLALAPGSIDAITALADALEESGQPRRATSILESALADRPDHPELLTRLGMTHVSAGELEQAEQVLRRAIELRGDAPAARAALGRLLGMTGRPDAAVREYHAALDSIPSFAAAALGLSDLLTEYRRTAEAVAVLAGFLEVDPYHFGALVRLGDLLWESGRQKEAGFAYRRVLRFDPGHPDAREGLERLEPAAAKPARDSWPALKE
jgi:tetratricopeptide (TPR) repeat protein